MTQFTPTTEGVRNFWIYSHEQRDGSLTAPKEVLAAEFDRWLAQHDAETAAKALEEAAQIADAYAGETRTYRDNETDYPKSWFGMQVHGQAHGAQDAAIRIRARAAAIRTQQEGTE